MIEEIKHTFRGFIYCEFTDRNGYACSLQKSSVATEDCIWLGLDSASPKKLVLNQGWVEVELPEGVDINTRMHLTRGQARVLAAHLQYFAEFGDLPEKPIANKGDKK